VGKSEIGLFLLLTACISWFSQMGSVVLGRPLNLEKLVVVK
jgi:hypothetical protein